MMKRARLKRVRLKRWTRFALQCLLLLLITLFVFGDLLFFGDRVVSAPDGDGATLFLGVRAWGFDQIRYGHLPLWNPHLFCGTPFLGGFQSALLYPPNLLYAWLPIERAFNIDVALHIWLSGVFMLAWLWRVRVGGMAGLLGAIVFMLGGPHFLHVYAGHLPQLCTIAWTPLIFLAIDRATSPRRTSHLSWALLGAFALAMQILAGFPQFVLYNGLIAMLYACARLLQLRSRARPMLPAIRSLLLLVALGAGLSAIQWVTSVDILAETTRRHLPLEVVAHYSLPFENLLTLIAPGFFGDMAASPYWGRWYLWETMLFIGVAPFVLAIYGVWRSGNNHRKIAITLATLSILLAIGSQTPLFGFLYSVVPGFAQFRGPAKFTLPALFFLATLSAFGLQSLMTTVPTIRRLWHALVGVGAVMLMLAGLIWILNPADFAKLIFRAVDWNAEHFIRPDPSHFAGAGKQAVQSIAWAGAILIVNALIIAMRARRNWSNLLVVLAACELVLFARHYRPTFVPSQINAAATSDLRVDNPNQSDIMRSGGYSIWGNDATVLQRYRDLAGALGGLPDAAEPTQSPFVRDASRLGLLRVGPKALPRAILVPQWQVIPDRAQALDIISGESFDRYQNVILESSPSFTVGASIEGERAQPSLDLFNITPEQIHVRVTATEPSILLITDNYAKGWKVRSFDARRALAEPQPPDDPTLPRYNVMPGDVSLIAIPLAAGHHLLWLSYEPRGFVVGKAITITSVVIVIALLIVYTSRFFTSKA